MNVKARACEPCTHTHTHTHTPATVKMSALHAYSQSYVRVLHVYTMHTQTCLKDTGPLIVGEAKRDLVIALGGELYRHRGEKRIDQIVLS